MITYSEVLKTREVVIKMVLLYLKKGKNSANWQQRLKFLGIILEFHPYERKNVFEKLNHICFVTWAVTVNPNIRVCVISLACTKMEK